MLLFCQLPHCPSPPQPPGTLVCSPWNPEMHHPIYYFCTVLGPGPEVLLFSPFLSCQPGILYPAFSLDLNDSFKETFQDTSVPTASNVNYFLCYFLSSLCFRSFYDSS